VPVRESLAALDATGYDGWLTVEWEKRWHPELAEPEDALPRELETLMRWRTPRLKGGVWDSPAGREDP
jgi:sugar phosphate isomerase/epimerase